MCHLKKGLTALLVILGCSLIVGCTNPRWIVTDQESVDPDDYEVVSSTRFLSPEGEVTPENPVLGLRLLSAQKYRYAEKVLMQRHVQDYTINWGLMAFSLAGAGVAFWAANSSSIINNDKRLKALSLNVAGGMLTLFSIISVNPEGEPRPTGEQRFLRKTGSHIEVDTVQVEQPESDEAFVTIEYGEKVIIDNTPYQLNDGLLQIDLGSPLNELEITGNQPGVSKVSVNYRDTTFAYTIPVNNILQPYARVTAPLTELRNAPNSDIDNVLAELVEGSQLQIAGESEDQWYKVLYGISENYILKSDAEKVWRSSGFADQNVVQALPNLPFGEVDVESNIPILKSQNKAGAALIITNEHYGERYPPRTYAIRDGRLIKEYLKNALGYSEDRILHLSDVSRFNAVMSALDSLKSFTTDSTELFIYLSGYGKIDRENGNTNIKMIPAGEDSAESTFILQSLFSDIGAVLSDFTVIFADLDFSRFEDESEAESQVVIESPLRVLASEVTGNNDQAAVIFSSRPGQSSNLYTDSREVDKKHHIFPYYIARAIQQRNTTLSAIYEYLERNISYTSRKLHDIPQEPQIYGNSAINLVH